MTKTRTAILSGYAQTQNGYNLWNFKDNKAVVSRDILYDKSKHNISRNILEECVQHGIQFDSEQKSRNVEKNVTDWKICIISHPGQLPSA